MLLITIFGILVLAGVAKLIYDTQQKKKQTPTKTIDDFEFKDDFQKLAGIKPIETTTYLPQANIKYQPINYQNQNSDYAGKTIKKSDMRELLRGIKK